MFMRMLAGFAVGLFLVAAQPAIAQTAQGGDRVWNYADSDAAMNAAIAEGRTYLDPFLTMVREAGNRTEPFMVKVALDAIGGGREHIWVDNLRFDGAVLKGELANAPNQLGALRQGSTVTIDRDRISDWAIITGDGMYGNFTTRVMLPQLDPTERAQIAAMLSRTPVPPSWRK